MPADTNPFAVADRCTGRIWDIVRAEAMAGDEFSPNLDRHAFLACLAAADLMATPQAATDMRGLTSLLLAVARADTPEARERAYRDIAMQASRLAVELATHRSVA